VEELTAMKERVYQVVLVIGLAMVVIGATLYAVNSEQRTLTYGMLIAGTSVLVLCGALNYRLIVTFVKKRSSRYGANMIVMIVVFTATLVIIQTLSIRHSYRYDLTRNKRFSLAEQTTGILDSLDQNVDLYAFYQKSAPDKPRAEDLLKRFAHRTTRFQYQFIDPDQRPQRAKDMGIVTYGTIVVEAGGTREYVKDLNEENLLNAIVRATRDEVKVVYFVRGHGEKDPVSDKPAGYSIAAEALEKENFEVKTVSLFDEDVVPEDCSVLVVAGPKRDFIESEIEKIKEYLRKGRNAFFLIDPQTDLPNIQGLLGTYKIVINNDAIVDPFSRVFGGDYSVPVVTAFENHPITRNFDVAVFFPTARSVGIAETDVEAVTVQYLAKTGKSAWGETNLDLIDRGQAVKDEEDYPAPLPIALIAVKRFEDGVPDSTGVDRSEVVVFGDTDFADNGSFRLSGNADLFLNVINYLAEEKDRIAIRAKRGLGDRLLMTESQGRFIFLISVVVLPLSVITFGATVFVRRQRRG
jgi:ABC-type uncharacterized transport system involved in gliding motility auxiliary subunit